MGKPKKKPTTKQQTDQKPTNETKRKPKTPFQRLLAHCSLLRGLGPIHQVVVGPWLNHTVRGYRDSKYLNPNIKSKTQGRRFRSVKLPASPLLNLPLKPSLHFASSVPNPKMEAETLTQPRFCAWSVPFTMGPGVENEPHT